MTMLVSPWSTAVLRGVQDWDEHVSGVVAASHREIGSTFEVDADLLAQAGLESLARDLVTYDERCRSFWADGPEGPYVVTLRELSSVAQIDRREGRTDLVEELAFLHDVPGVGAYVRELLTRDPDGGRLYEIGGLLGARLNRDGERGTCELRLTDQLTYPTTLGGPGSVGEVARHLHLEVNWAKWRDRAARRLVRITAVAEEVWPDPQYMGLTNSLSERVLIAA